MSASTPSRSDDSGANTVIELLPMGDRAVIVTGMADPAAWSRTLVAALDAATCSVVPAAETVLVACGSVHELAVLVPTIRSVDASVISTPMSAAHVEIPVVYDGEDLEEVARATGLSVADVVALHADATYTVAFCGFAPGFAYLRGLPAQLRLPRRPTPRTRVPAGAVAIASEFSAVYPRASPGGWNLLGRTSVMLFDPSAGDPALLHPGDRVRFIPTAAGVGQSAAQSADQSAARPSTTSPPSSDKGAAFTVVAAGVATSVQDAGRGGFGDIGVSPSGMVDAALGRAVNRFVSNPADAPLIETCGGLVIRAECPLVVASTATIAPTVLSSGETFTVGGGGGLRWHYLAIRGGVVAERALGSSSTDTLSGLGPAPLTAGQSFTVGHDPAGLVADSAPLPIATNRVRISPGPRLDWFWPDTLATLAASSLTVSDANRIGVRLTGPTLVRIRHDELPSEGLVRGAIQVVPSGELVMMLADHPTTGGYPVVAVVHPDDVATVAQRETFACIID